MGLFDGPGFAGEHHVAEGAEAFAGANVGHLFVDLLVVDGSLDVANDAYGEW